MANQLFWINKDATSSNFSRSSKEERSAIQSKVQSGRSRNRKPKAKPQQDIASNNEARPTYRPKELYDYHSRQMVVTLDPFNSATVKLDNTISGLLRYYVYYYHPAQWPNEPFESRGPYTFKTSVTRIVSTAVHDNLMLFSLLTAASCRLQYVDHLSFPNVSRNEDSYAARALQLLRGRIEAEAHAPTADLYALLQCITFLLSAESYRNNFATARMHLKAALALLDQHGGIVALRNKHLREQLLMGDLFLGCVNLQPCLCGHDYDPGSSELLQLQVGEIEDAAGLDNLIGNSFLAQEDTIVPAELNDLIQQIIQVYLVKSRTRVHAMSTERALQVGHWITMRNMAIRNRLLAVDCQADVTKAIRTALIMWTLLAMNITGRLKTIKIMAQSLQTLLQRLPDMLRELPPNLAAWILIIGHMSSPVAFDTFSWFVYQLYGLETVRTAIAADYYCQDGLAAKLRAMQCRFLYDDTVQGPLTDALAVSLLALHSPDGRQGRLSDGRRPFRDPAEPG